MIDVPGAKLYLLEIGSGAPLVALHGGPGASHDYLRPQLDQLLDAKNGRLIYYDQRGGGRSPLDPGQPPGSADEHVADLEALRRQLGISQLRLVGYSWGGLLALLYALAHPDRVSRLVLISAAPAAAREREGVRERLAAAGRRPAVESLRQTLDPTDRRSRFALAVAGYFFDPRRALELTPFVVRQAAEEAVWRSLGDYDLRPRLRGLGIPTFMAHGLADPIPIESARETADALGAQLLELPECGHAPYIEAPSLLMPAARQFLAA